MIGTCINKDSVIDKQHLIIHKNECDEFHTHMKDIGDFLFAPLLVRSFLLKFQQHFMWQSNREVTSVFWKSLKQCEWRILFGQSFKNWLFWSKSVWNFQRKAFRLFNYLCSPEAIFSNHLISSVKSWKVFTNNTFCLLQTYFKKKTKQHDHLK